MGRKVKRKVRCILCGSTNVTKYGRRNTRGVKKQRYHCKNCRKKFIRTNNFRMRNKKSLIDKSLKLRKQGMTYSQIAEKINYKVTRHTIRHWVQKFDKTPMQDVIVKRWIMGYWRKINGVRKWIKGHYAHYKVRI
jgi:transposase-like protein